MQIDLLLTQILLVFTEISATLTEWVDLPQFSDEAKVYRFSSIIKPENIQDSDRKFQQTVTSDLRNVSKWHFDDDQDHPFSKILPFLSEARVTLSNIDIKDDDEEEETEEEEDKKSTQIESYEDYVNPTESTIISNSEAQSNIEPCESQGNRTEHEDEAGFMDYLPVDLLKQVHNTLKAQPTTLKGKILFLKSFEKALLSEIESRLTTSLAPTRKTRASDYEHDDIGFPSVEGALMIISLLTFAIYLIRLVMAMIQNMSGANGPQTIFLGRRKRSTEELTEEITRILNYIDSYGSIDYGKFLSL